MVHPVTPYGSGFVTPDVSKVVCATVFRRPCVAVFRLEAVVCVSLEAARKHREAPPQVVLHTFQLVSDK